MQDLLKAIIVDDEPEAIKNLELHLEQFNFVRVIEKSTYSQSAVQLIKKNNPDLVFLDVHMPVKNGIDVLKEISAMDIEVFVIMVTAFDNYLLESFRNFAFDYLLKPFELEDLENLFKRLKDY